MSLTSKIEQDFITAYKAKDADKVAVLRHVKTAIKNLQVELCRAPDDDEVLGIVSKQLKQRKDSMEQYQKADRPELADVEAREMEVLKTYLPQSLSREELTSLVDSVIAETNASGMKDMGKVMQAVMAAAKGRVDGKEVSELVKSKLAS